MTLRRCTRRATGICRCADVRAAPDWRFWLGQGHTALVLEDSRGRVVAYASVDPPASAERLRMAEASAADAGAARALVAHCWRTRVRQGQRSTDPGAAAGTSCRAGGPAHGRRSPARRTLPDGEQPDEAALAGVVDLPLLLEALAPEFERRLARSRYAGWSGNLRIEIETERITLAFAEGARR